jgi:hypothetical protein
MSTSWSYAVIPRVRGQHADRESRSKVKHLDSGSRGGGWWSEGSAAKSLLGPDLSADDGPEQFAVIAVES